jgi:hypothetical protein
MTSTCQPRTLQPWERAVKPDKPKAVDFQKRKYAKTVMHFYDKFDRAIKREERVEKSEVERDARKRW